MTEAVSEKLEVYVTDHAVLRYLERVGGFNIEGLRSQIANRVARAASVGAPKVTIDGYIYKLSYTAGRAAVATVTPREGKKP